MKSILLTIIPLILMKSGISAENEEQVSYQGFQMWKVELNNKTDLEYFEKLEDNNSLKILGGNSTAIDLLIDPNIIQTLQKDLKSKNLKTTISLGNIQHIIDQEKSNFLHLKLENRKRHRLTWQAYHPLIDIYGYLYYLADTYPKFVKIQSIGKSIENRPILLLKISNGNPNNSAIWIDGGIHAREWISPSTATYIIDTIINNYDYEPESVRKIDWYIVSILNPDGYEFSYNVDRFWRKNRRKTENGCIGVDLNRNFGYQWDGYGSSLDSCTNRYRGKVPFSEPETASVARFFLNNKNKIYWRGFLSIHSYGQYIVYPWGSATSYSLDDQKELDDIGRLAAQAILLAGGVEYKVGELKTTLYQTSGTSTDWARGVEAVKYVYTIELRDNGRFGFLLPAESIKDTAEEAMILVRTMANVASR